MLYTGYHDKVFHCEQHLEQCAMLAWDHFTIAHFYEENINKQIFFVLRKRVTHKPDQGWWWANYDQGRLIIRIVHILCCPHVKFLKPFLHTSGKAHPALAWGWGPETDFALAPEFLWAALITHRLSVKATGRLGHLNAEKGFKGECYRCGHTADQMMNFPFFCRADGDKS